MAHVGLGHAGAAQRRHHPGLGQRFEAGAPLGVVGGVGAVDDDHEPIGRRGPAHFPEDEALAEVAAVGGIRADSLLGEHVRFHYREGHIKRRRHSSGVIKLEIGLEGGLHQVGMHLASRQLRRGQKQRRVAAAREGHGQLWLAQKVHLKRLAEQVLTGPHVLGVLGDDAFEIHRRFRALFLDLCDFRYFHTRLLCYIGRRADAAHRPIRSLLCSAPQGAAILSAA